MTVTPMSRAERWAWVGAIAWLVSLSFALPLVFVLALLPWRAATNPDRYVLLAIASGLTLAFSIVARRRARLLDANQRLADWHEIEPDSFGGRLFYVPMSADQWRQLERIAKS